MLEIASYSNSTLKRRFGYSVVLALVLVTLLPGVLQAHPLGNFTVNRYSRLEVAPRHVTLTYVIDMAEIPTQQERPQIDTDGDGQFSPAEQDAYLAQKLPLLQEHLHLGVDGNKQSWSLTSHELSFPEGQAGLPTMRLSARFVSPIEPGEAIAQVTYRDENFSGRLGWQEVIVHTANGVDLLASSVPTIDLSRELTEYPADLLQSPPSVNQAEFQYRLVHRGSTGAEISQIGEPQLTGAELQGAPPERSRDPFAELIERTDLGPWTLFVALLAAFGWGAAHALSPGHGKTIVGAYLVGSRGTAKHALFLGLTTTITHTAGVFVLGLLTLFASRYILPETLYPWLSVASGLLVIAIGLSMAWSWLRKLWPAESTHLDRSHGSEHAHVHAHPHAGEHHALREDSLKVVDGVAYHRHGAGDWHSHEVPGQNGSPVTWRSLLALGISGGLLPCPSALVVMLGAIALQRIAFGLLLITAFSLGLAGVLTGFGLVLVFASKFFSRLPESGRIVKLLPIASALFITLVGIGIAWQAVGRL